MARRLDEQPTAVELCDESVPAPASSDTGLTLDGRRILAAIERLSEGEREAFDLVRIQGRSQSEAAQVLEVLVMTSCTTAPNCAAPRTNKAFNFAPRRLQWLYDRRS